MMEIKRTIKYDADRVRGFGGEVMEVPGYEDSSGWSPAGLGAARVRTNNLMP